MEALTINGIEKQFPSGLPDNLAELLGQIKIKSATVVAEIDGEIIDRDNFSKTKVADGQKIELIRFMGGG